MSRRVVVTGLGVASPIGLGIPAFWSALLDGRTGVGPLTGGLLGEVPPGAGGRALPIPIAEAKQFYDPRTIRNATMADPTLLAVVATGDLLANTGLDRPDAARPSYGAYVGSEVPYPPYDKQARSAITLYEPDAAQPDGWRFDDDRLGESLRHQSAFDFLKSLPNMASSHVAIRGGFQGPAATILGSAAAGLQALIEATSEIRAGVAEGMLVCAAWGPFAELYLNYLARRGWLADPGDDPAAATRPFDADARGMLPGEAGVAFLLESLETAQARGAEILAEVVGGQVRFTPAGADDELATRAEAVAAAIPEDLPLDAIAVGGTGVPAMDELEGQAWVEAVGAGRAAGAAWICTTGACGYTGPAAAPLSLLAALLASREGTLPPLPNLTRPGSRMGPIRPRPRPEPASLRGIGASAFSFEGYHAAVALRPWSGAEV